MESMVMVIQLVFIVAVGVDISFNVRRVNRNLDRLIKQIRESKGL